MTCAVFFIAALARYMDDQALQVSNAIVMASDSPAALTELSATLNLGFLLTCSLHLPKNGTRSMDFLKKETIPFTECPYIITAYRVVLPTSLASKQPFCLCPAGVCWQY